MSKKRLLTVSDLPILDECMKGWSTFDAGCITTFNQLLRKDKCGVKELKLSKTILEDKIRPATDLIFLVWNQYPSYIKYEAMHSFTVVPSPPVSFQEMSDQVKSGKVKINEIPLSLV